MPALATAGQPRKAEATPAILGCVYRLTSDEVIDALLPIESCIVVDRQQRDRRPLERLRDQGRSLSTLHLPGFEDVALPLPGGIRPVIGPGTPYPMAVEVGPVRVAGWAASRGKSLPYVHVKVLVAGRTWVWEDQWGREGFHFTPLCTWMGSANWTTFASAHLEFGMWSDDPELLRRNLQFLLNAVRFSQDLDSALEGAPKPELVDSDWDDAAFAEYVRDLGSGEPEPFDDEWP